MATVYLAEDLRHDRQVAIKVLRPDLAASLGQERFHREIKIAARLQHPHILPLLDSGSVEDQTAEPPPTALLYYVMPYVEGQSLRDKLVREGELPIGDAVRILRDVVDALTEAHANGVVHRDIKPENILLRGRHALVMDFGVAKAVTEATGREQLTTAGVTIGTPTYMAPEQAAADPQLDARVDIYAVGALGYELLAGRPVFMGTTPQMVLAAHVTQTPVPLSQRRESVPAALESLIMKCLEKKPADRWQSADELLPRLEALTTPSGGLTPAATVPVTAVADGTKRRVWRRLAAWAAGTVAVLLAGVVIGRMLLPSPGPTLDLRRVAFIPLENRTGDTSLSYVGRMVAEELGNTVTREHVAEVVPVANVIAVLEDDPSDRDSREMAVAHATGAGIVVSGAVYPDGDRLRLQLTATDAVRQVPFVAIDPTTTSRDSLAWATGVVRDQVSVLLLMAYDEEVGAVAATLGYPTLEAYRVFLDGKERFWELNLEVALSRLLRAAEMDPAVRPMALILAQHAAGRTPLADSIFAELLAMRDELPEYPRAVIDVWSAIYDGNLERAYQTGTVMVRLLTGNPSPRIWHAYLCLAANRPRESLEVLDGIDSLVGDSRGRMWWVMRRRRDAYFRLGAFDDALRAARALSDLTSDPVRVTQDRQDELVILATAGRLSELEHEVDRFAALGAPEAGVGRSLANVALATRLRGEGAAAEEVIEHAVSWWEIQPAGLLAAPEQQFRYAETLYAAQRWDEAESELERQASGRPGDVRVIGYLGLVAARKGNRERADSIAHVLLGAGEPDGDVVPLVYRARIAAVLGDRELAVQLLRRAISLGYEFFGQPFEQFPRWDFASLSTYGPYLELTEPRG